MQTLMQPSPTDGQGAGQDLPGAPAVSTGPSASAAAPPAAPSTPSGQFSSDILSALISLQSKPPTVADVAGQVISSLDKDGDGSLNASEFQQAVAGAGGSSAAGQDAFLTAAFAKLDTNGDGQIGGSELASALQNAVQGAGRHGHHHHHHAVAASDSDQTPASASTPASTPADPSSGTTTPAVAAA